MAHDPNSAAYWSAWAAGASAVAALLSFWGSVRSAAAAERALYLPIKANLVVEAVETVNGHPQLRIRNAGPSPAHTIAAWPSRNKGLFYGQYEPRFGGNKVAEMHLAALLEVNATATFDLLTGYKPCVCIIDWADAAGNFDQTHISIYPVGSGHSLLYIGAASRSRETWFGIAGTTLYDAACRYGCASAPLSATKLFLTRTPSSGHATRTGHPPRCGKR